uniref:protein FAM171A1 isoform X2 n=1 Tax=Myxine glutinosa TaxID=7769 RepID=UPI00358F1A78
MPLLIAACLCLSVLVPPSNPRTVRTAEQHSSSSAAPESPSLLLRVSVLDSNSRRPLRSASVQVFGNRKHLVSGLTSKAGVASLHLPPRHESNIVVRATSPGYVHASMLWRPRKLPRFSSVTLLLLPELPASLTVYDDSVTMLGGIKSPSGQPSIHFSLQSMELPTNSSYNHLVAFLTLALTPADLNRFPLPLGLDNDTKDGGLLVELTPLVAMTARIETQSGVNIPVEGKVQICLPLPDEPQLQIGQDVASWSYDDQQGIWKRAGHGLVRQQGAQLVWEFEALSLGYWAASLSPGSPVGFLEQIMAQLTDYHSILLLAILAGLVLLLLAFSCLLLCYCRTCRKGRNQRRRIKRGVLGTMDAGKRDQSTSMSHLNLINAVRMESLSTCTEAEQHTPIIKASYMGSRDTLNRHKAAGSGRDGASRDFGDSLTGKQRSMREGCHRSAETLQLTSAPSDVLLSRTPERPDNIYRHGPCDDHRHSASSAVAATQTSDEFGNHMKEGQGLRPQVLARTEVNDGAAAERRAADISRSVDALARPVTLPGHLKGQLLCYSSVDQMNDVRFQKMLQPTLFIPAHYMQLPGLPPQYRASSAETDRNGSQGGPSSTAPSLQQQQSQAYYPQGHDLATQETESDESGGLSESISIPVTLSEAAMTKLNAEIHGLSDKSMLEPGDIQSTRHPRAWFISLDGRAQVRHSYIDLQRSERPGSQDASLDSGVDVSGRSGGGSGIEAGRLQRRPLLEERRRHQSGVGPVYTRLLRNRSESETAVAGAEDGSLKPLLGGSVNSRDGVPNLSPGDAEDEEEEMGMTTEYLSHLQSPPEAPRERRVPFRDSYNSRNDEHEATTPTETSLGDYGREMSRTKSKQYSKQEQPEKAGATEYLTRTQGEFATRPTDFNHEIRHGGSARESLQSPDDGDDQGESKKSPWQKREERPLMVFNLKHRETPATATATRNQGTPQVADLFTHI